MPAKFEHDCNQCIFLGREEEHDLYYCPNHGGCLVARRSSVCWDYSSWDITIGAREGLHRRTYYLYREKILGEIPQFNPL